MVLKIFFTAESVCSFFGSVTTVTFSVNSHHLGHMNKTSEGKMPFGIRDDAETKNTGHLPSSKQKAVVLKGHVQNGPLHCFSTYICLDTP